MQRAKKILIVLLLTLSLLTISACKSTPKVEYTVPPQPQRAQQEPPKTIKDYALLIAYYEGLVQEWELWGAEALQIINEVNKGESNP